MVNLNKFINLSDIAKASKSFGMVGAAANKTPIIIVNDNQTVATQEVVINKPIVKMINVLASIDGFLKQRLENQKTIARNQILTNRESTIEQKNQEPEIHVITPDAEKESGSRLGLYALGGLALLAFDPVQDAIKQIADITIQSGQFISNAVKTINDVFNFLFSSSSETSETSNATAEQIRPANGTPNQGQGRREQSETQSRPSSEENLAPAANTNDAMPVAAPVGNEVRRTTSNVSRGSMTSSAPAPVTSVSTPAATPASAPASTPAATPASSTSSTPAATPASTTTTSAEPATTANAGGIPRGDIVALGRYLQGQGVTPSEHPEFGPVSRIHSTNSRHYRGMAMDLNVKDVGNTREGEIFDQLEPQLRAAGYYTIWRKPGHETHMHVSVGGPEGDYGESTASSITGTISSIASASLEKVAELFGILGSALEPGSPRNNIPLSIAIAARELNVNIAETRTPTPPTLPTPSAPPRINRMPGGPTQNPPTMTDRNSVYYYLRRFGYQDLNSPESVIPAT
jgi:hypothetical protein